MGVLMQAFYWDCPRVENQEYRWWTYITSKILSLRTAGFTALWLPPANKAANIGGPSMGYDPYDYYDLGEFEQKGSTKTWFGAKAELLALIHEAHRQQMEVYADLVLNHNNGADAEELNPIDHTSRWTRFTPRSRKFPRTWECFHPSVYESWDGMTFGGMPDLCHRNPVVYTELLAYARWLLDHIGFDGFRYDCVKGYGGWMVRAIQELRTRKGNKVYKPYGVGECWDSERVIHDWLDETNAWSDNPAGAFDFPLRERLRDLCQVSDYSVKHLLEPGTLLNDRPEQAVTFVENHDIARTDPIITDKMLAYAFVLTHEGYPCVFWQDYYTWGLGEEGSPNGIAALVRLHEDYAGGATSVLHIQDDLYLMQRDGHDRQKGLIFVLNTQEEWQGAWVQTQWHNMSLVPMAWRGKNDADIPQTKQTHADGWIDLWAPPRGYAVYVPQA